MRHHYLSLPLLFFAVASQAASLTPQQALERLTASPSVKKIVKSGSVTSAYSLQQTIGNLYVFSHGDGYVILPADDAAPALLAYSDNGQFSPQENPALVEWLGNYNREIDYLRENKNAGERANETLEAARVNRSPISPLIKTEWNQEAPYNELCPKVDGHETVTGCVATAMAQVLKFYNYPVHGKGTHSYLWRPGEEELTFDYESTDFQWDLMTDRYDSKSTAEEKHAVAELMLGCGISVDMHYEPGGSGAATTLMGESLINIFDYSPSLWMPNRVFYGYYEWEEMIYDELAEGRPVLYSGAGTAGGHQFICDGYSTDSFFHFNWGWGGLSNGYFLLTALNPDDLGVGGGAGGFNSSQIATLGVRPAEAGDKVVYIMYNTESFEAEQKSVKVGEDFSASGLYFNYSLANLPDDSRLGMRFKSSDGSDVVFAQGPGVGGYHPDDGRRNIEVKFPDLPDGTYIITPALHADGRWTDVRMPVGYASEITATVEDGIATFADEQAAEVTIELVKEPTVIYRDREFPMPFKATNSSDSEYYGSVTPVILNAEGKEVAKSQFRPLDVMGKQEQTISDYIADFSALKDEEFPAGDYQLVFRDEAGRNVSQPIAVTVEILTAETEIKVTDFRLDEKDPIILPEEVKFSFTVECTSGLFYDNLTLYVFPGDGGYADYHHSTPRLYLIGGDKEEVTLTTDLSDLKDGYYMAYIYKGGSSVSDIIRFHIDRLASSVGQLSANTNLEPEVTIYDLNGLPCSEPLSPGIYILRHGTETHKIVVR